MCSSGLVGYADCLTRSRSPVRSRARVPKAFVSVVGAWSSGMILRSGRRGREFDSPCAPLLPAKEGGVWPTGEGRRSQTPGPVRFHNQGRPLWRSWQRVGLIIPRSWVRYPPEAVLLPTNALVAQLAALRSYEPMVRGSSPRRSIVFTVLAGWPSGLRRWF